LVTALKLTPFAIAQTGRPVLYMKTADSNSSPLAKYMKFEFGCKGIWRTVYTFISPDSKNKNRHLLLGLPWLHSVRAVLDILISTIQIGDPDINKKPILIQGPKFKESISHNLIFYPMATQYKHAVELAKTLMNQQPERYYRHINEDTETTLNNLNGISISSSSDLETIDTSDEIESSSDSDSGSTFSSSVAATESSSVESKDESDEDIVGNNVNSPIRTSAIGLLRHLQLLYLPSELDIDEQIQQVTLYFYCMQY
jgi:hypothetical protein